MNIIEIFQKNVQKYPEKVAIIYENIQYSYKQVEQDIKKTSFYFENIGIKPNIHVLLLLNNSYEFVISMLALANIGAVLVPLSTTLKPKAISKAAKSTDALYVITLNSIAIKLKNSEEFCMQESNIITLDLHAYTDTNDYQLNQNKILPSQDFILTMTSGSTGEPKPIVFTQETKINRAILAAKNLYNLDENEIILTASPLYHSMGQRLVLLPLLIGATSIILNKFTPKLWLDAVQKHQITFTIAIASHLEILLNALNDVYNISSLKSIVSSSSLLKEDIKQRCITKFNCDFHECYGASEVGIVTNLAPQDCKENLSSVGKALEFVDLKIVDENKQEVRTGIIGEIICKSDTAFSRYYKNKEQTGKSVIDGYFYTGDLGYLDDKGYLSFSGRKKDLIIVGGTNVYPADIEEIIEKVDGVKECCVIGVEDQYFGEAIVAVIVTDDENFNLKKVRLACAKELADYQQPMAYEIIANIPKNNLGKVMRHKIKEMFIGYDATKALRKIMER